MAKILVVDDHRDTVETMAELLKLFGHDVQIARNGNQAIECALRQRPDYVLLDLGLPGMDGYQVAARLRQELATSIIIAITGYGHEDDRRRAREAGCDHFFLKPVDPNVLLPLLSASSSSQRPAIQPGPSAEAMDGKGRAMVVVGRRVEIINTLGLHLRAAERFVRLLRPYRAEVWVSCNGRKVSGRSILDLTTLACARGTELELVADGPDAEAAMDALTGLVGRRFDEED